MVFEVAERRPVVLILVLSLMATGCAERQPDVPSLDRLVQEILTVDTMEKENDLRAQCMAENGFEFDIPSSSLVRGPEVDPDVRCTEASRWTRSQGRSRRNGPLHCMPNTGT